MAKQWAKVHRDAMLSERLCCLWRKSKTALALYWPLKAHADDFGRFTADPARFAHVIGGLARITPTQAARALDAMEACGLIRRYEVDGDELLEIVDYHRHDRPNWLRVSGPEYPPPPDWEPPADLVAFAEQYGHLKNVTPDRYGLRVGLSAACDRVVHLMSRTGDSDGAAPEPTALPSPVPTPVSTPAGTGVPTGVPAGAEHDGNRLDQTRLDQTRPDTDVHDEESQESTSNGNGNGARPYDDLPDDVGMKKLNYPNLRNACFDLPWSQHICDRWLVELIIAIEGEADWYITDEDDAVALLERYPPKATEKHLPAKWLERIEREREEAEDDRDPDLDRAWELQRKLDAEREARWEAYYAEHPEERPEAQG